MERLPSDQKLISSPKNNPEEVRGILQRLLRMATRVMAKKLFARSQAQTDHSLRKQRFPKT